MAKGSRGRRRDLWAAARSTTGSANLLVTSDAPLISVRTGTVFVVDGRRVTVKSIQAEGDTITIVAKAGAQ